MRRVLWVILLLLSIKALATHVAVLETMADGDTKDRVSLLDRQYLTNVLREQAVKELPARDGFTIMTRENINAMLPPGKAIEDCEGSCLAETGRNIAADYVCQARVGRFGSKLTLSAELYEIAGNKLIATFNGRGADVEELLVLIESKSAEFFREIKNINRPEKIDTQLKSAQAEWAEETSTRIKAVAAYAELEDKDSSRVGKSVSTNVEGFAKKGGFLTISAVVTAVGVVVAVMGNIKAKESSEKTWMTEDEYRDYHQDAKDFQKMRAIGIGIAIVGAIGIGLSVAF